MNLKPQIGQRTLKLLSAGCLVAVAFLVDPNPSPAADATINAERINSYYGLDPSYFVDVANGTVRAETIDPLLDGLEVAVSKADWAQVDELQDALRHLGPGAIPFLLQRMKKEGVDRSVKFYLLDTLRRIHGEKT